MKVGETELAWHAVDTKNYNVNLYHFAHALNKPTSYVLFWAVTVVNCPARDRGVRLAIGSNAASVWWVNGQEVIGIYGDRQTVIDDGVSKRLTLKKGPNVDARRHHQRRRRHRFLRTVPRTPRIDRSPRSRFGSRNTADAHRCPLGRRRLVRPDLDHGDGVRGQVEGHVARVGLRGFQATELVGSVSEFASSGPAVTVTIFTVAFAGTPEPWRRVSRVSARRRS